MTLRRRTTALGAALCASLTLVACSAPAVVPADPIDTASRAYPALTREISTVQERGSSEASLAETALEVLDTIPVREKTEWDGPFNRAEHFGDRWADLDGDGCNTRNEMLDAQLEDVVLLRDHCRVDSGVLLDPYTGDTVRFERGRDSSESVQIDHVVAVYNAWRTGAQDLSPDERIQFANDPINLQATQDWVNDEKMSHDASQWLPPDESYHCTYVARQIAVKATYQLWVTPREDAAMREVLESCE